MASGPITSCQIDGETVETVADFIFGGSKITADGDCSHDLRFLNVELEANFFTLLFNLHIKGNLQ